VLHISTVYLTNLLFMIAPLFLLLQSHARERKDIMAVSTLDELRDWLDEQSVRFLHIKHTILILYWILSHHVSSYSERRSRRQRVSAVCVLY
jgi:hypothetical protein